MNAFSIINLSKADISDWLRYHYALKGVSLYILFIRVESGNTLEEDNGWTYYSC